MGKTVIKESMFSEIIDLYNTEGRTAAYDLIRSRYGLKHPYSTITRIKRSGKYLYDEESDRFISSDAGTSAESVFMGLDELCGTPVPVSATHSAELNTVDRSSAMEKLIRELMSDRLLMLSRYITLDTSSRTVLIDESSLSSDGYKIVTH